MSCLQRYVFASAWLLILLCGLVEIFTARLVPAIISSVSDSTVEKQRAQWLGIVNGGASAGWIIGSILGGLLYDRFDYVVLFAASITMAVTTLLLAVFLIPETKQRCPSRSLAPDLDLQFSSYTDPVALFPAPAYQLWCNVRLGVHRASIHILCLRYAAMDRVPTWTGHEYLWAGMHVGGNPY